MRQIILDTNFLLIPVTQKVDIFSEIDRIIPERYQLYIIDKSLDELDNIAKTAKQKDRSAAAFAKQLIIKKNIQIINTGKKNTVDEEILLNAKKGTTIVATQDKMLKNQLKMLQIPVIILRQKRHLQIDGE
jgi:rRNA-processing protein FCF1